MIQHSFLPKEESINSIRRDVQIAAGMKPTREVGGDFYDFFTLDRPGWRSSSETCAERARPASLFAARVVTLLRALGRDRREAVAVIARANELLCEENDAAMFATAFFGVLDLRSGELVYCNCGHVAPYISRPRRRLKPAGPHGPATRDRRRSADRGRFRAPRAGGQACPDHGWRDRSHGRGKERIRGRTILECIANVGALLPRRCSIEIL